MSLDCGVNIGSIRDHLSQQGAAMITAPSDVDLADFVTRIASDFGRPLGMRNRDKVVEELTIVDNDAAKMRSLSKEHGVGQFPLHTDTAHWSIPCRYVLLACLNPGGGHRRTHLVDWADLGITAREEQALKTSPFRVRNGKSSFYATIMPPGREFVRYDSGCMQPVVESAVVARQLVETRLAEVEPTYIDWQPGAVLVLDNWRVLHGRGATVVDDVDRKLIRVLVQ